MSRAPDDVALGLDARDVLKGNLPADAGPLVTIYENARRSATVPVEATPEGLRFSCQLRPLGEAQKTTLEVRDTQSERLYARGVIARGVRKNALGLRASDVFEMGHPPLSAVPWMSFDGVRLTIGGNHLPPGGDPGSLSVKAEPGVVATFNYPQPAPSWTETYWYWPNAGLSSFLLTIDLVSSAFESDPFHFEFVETTDGRERKLSDLWLPNDLSSFLSFTKDATKIDRVQRGIDEFSIVLPGYSSFRYLEQQFRRLGIDPASNVTILDWGCGIGRLTAHFLRNWPRAEVHGADIDSANVEWCRTNLATGHFTACPLWPPTEYEDGAFDALFGVSVMTHLSAEVQAAWLAELARILKPGGIALVTFAGPSGTAYGSRWRSAEWWAAWRRSGFDAESRDGVLTGFIADSDYYRQSTQSVENVAKTWSRHFEIVEIIEAAFGNQDLAIMRRR